MANAMFQLSIAQKVESPARLRKGEIRDTIERALHEIMPVVAEKQISISVDTANCIGDVFFEETQIEQVVLNLLDNACKFTLRGGSISARGYPCCWDGLGRVEPAAAGSDRRHAPNAYRVDIKDNGPGIPAANLGKIFEEYTSYGGGVDRSGGGLGLAICRMILNRHNGRIWADSGMHGATFSFVLPCQESGTELQSRTAALARKQAVGSSPQIAEEVL
jgi:signal transduction histidine kinase